MSSNPSNPSYREQKSRGAAQCTSPNCVKKQPSERNSTTYSFFLVFKTFFSNHCVSTQNPDKLQADGHEPGFGGRKEEGALGTVKPRVSLQQLMAKPIPHARFAPPLQQSLQHLRASAAQLAALFAEQLMVADTR